MSISSFLGPHVENKYVFSLFLCVKSEAQAFFKKNSSPSVFEYWEE